MMRFIAFAFIFWMERFVPAVVGVTEEGYEYLRNEDLPPECLPEVKRCVIPMTPHETPPPADPTVCSVPTVAPTFSPSDSPTSFPTSRPSETPFTSVPTSKPSDEPTSRPSQTPFTDAPSPSPVSAPTPSPAEPFEGLSVDEDEDGCVTILRADFESGMDGWSKSSSNAGRDGSKGAAFVNGDGGYLDYTLPQSNLLGMLNSTTFKIEFSFWSTSNTEHDDLFEIQLNRKNAGGDDSYVKFHKQHVIQGYHAKDNQYESAVELTLNPTQAHKFKLRFLGDMSANTEYVYFDYITLKTCDVPVPQYDCPLELIDFNEFSRGDYVKRLRDGVEVTAIGKGTYHTPEGKAVVFDTSRPTCSPKINGNDGDSDLGTPNKDCDPSGPGDGWGGRPTSPYPNCEPLGNVLVIQERSFPANDPCPDDTAGGGWIEFDFDPPVNFALAKLLDVDEGNTPQITVIYEDELGRNGTAVTKVTWTGDNRVVTEYPYRERVSKVSIEYFGSGSIAEIGYYKCPPTGVKPPVVPPQNFCKTILHSDFEDGLGAWEHSDNGRSGHDSGDGVAFIQGREGSISVELPQSNLMGTTNRTTFRFIYSFWSSENTEDADLFELQLNRKIEGDNDFVAFHKQVVHQGYHNKQSQIYNEVDLTLDLTQAHELHLRVEGEMSSNTENVYFEYFTILSCTEPQYEYACPIQIMDFNDLTPGEYVKTLRSGIEVEAIGKGTSYTPQNKAMVFDTANPLCNSGGNDGDPDLGAPNKECDPAGPGDGPGGEPTAPYPNCEPLGNVLVIQERDFGNGTPCPDDTAGGGWINFKFNPPMSLALAKLLDVDEGKTPQITVSYEDENNFSKNAVTKVTWTGDNGLVTQYPARDQVSKVSIEYFGSGSIAEIGYYDCPPVESAVSPCLEFLDEDFNSVNDLKTSTTVKGKWRVSHLGDSDDSGYSPKYSGSVFLRDNSAHDSWMEIELGSSELKTVYSEQRVSLVFDWCGVSVESGHKFRAQYSFNGGSTWIMAERWDARNDGYLVTDDGITGYCVNDETVRFTMPVGTSSLTIRLTSEYSTMDDNDFVYIKHAKLHWCKREFSLWSEDCFDVEKLETGNRWYSLNDADGTRYFGNNSNCKGQCGQPNKCWRIRNCYHGNNGENCWKSALKMGHHNDSVDFDVTNVEEVKICFRYQLRDYENNEEIHVRYRQYIDDAFEDTGNIDGYGHFGSSPFVVNRNDKFGSNDDAKTLIPDSTITGLFCDTQPISEAATGLKLAIVSVGDQNNDQLYIDDLQIFVSK